jgi:hypothetical protein
LFISIKIERENIMPENNPHSIAAGIIYFVSQINYENYAYTIPFDILF